MRASRMNIVTLRDDPSDAEIVSHKLLIRSGYLYKSGAGLYLYGPLMQRTLDKVRRIVASEIAEAGGLEITMPILQERALWERSGRWAAYQASRTMLTVSDRGGQEFGLAPTAEEVVTDYAASQVSSYKQLPVCYFQQHTKFRDEIRPRFGLMRVKEFIMMDAYSFHASEASLDETYQAMHQAYLRIFRRCGLQAFAVEADSGAIGGSASHEFMIDAAVGEDEILFNRASGYAANVERAQAVIAPACEWTWSSEQREVHTPAAGGIEDVLPHLHAAGYDGIDATRMLKTVLFVASTEDGDKRIAACVRGDREVNEVKLANAIARVCSTGVLDLRPMHDDEILQATGAVPGFAAPLPGLLVDACIVDDNLRDIGWLVTGGNKTDYHLAGFDLARDGRDGLIYADILLARPGDGDPRGGGALEQRRGIEAGHIFKLGTKYSAAMGATFTNEQNKLEPMIMGCYGIGSSRLVAAAVEQYHDDSGMIWPMALAPYHCVVVAAGKGSEHQEAAEGVYEQLRSAGVE
ncbi:MAG: proline--tRNA ligase, partial [Planctomycetota bacterium]